MRVDRSILEEYLDGELAAAQAAVVEQALRGDAGATKMLARLREERALRQAALGSYEPAAGEAAAWAGAWVEGFKNEPVGRVWKWRAGAMAAGLLLAVGCFTMGRVTAPRGLETTGGGAMAYVVEVRDLDGRVTTHEFANLEAANKFAKEVAQKAERVASASDSGVF